jgi:hypothetical protein
MFQVSSDGWRPITQFDTVAQGSQFPGAGFGVAGPVGVMATSAMVASGVGVIRELRASIDADARRTAEQITAKVSELKTAQRWEEGLRPPVIYQTRMPRASGGNRR